MSPPEMCETPNRTTTRFSDGTITESIDFLAGTGGNPALNPAGDGPGDKQSG
jgi:hypothetical protein